MGVQDGVSGSVRAAISAAAEATTVPSAEQLELLAPPSRFEAGASIGTNRTLKEVLRARGGGRPPGAQNLATRQMRDFIAKTIGDPMLDLARWSMHTPETLAKELGCTLLEAFDRLLKLHEALLPYMHARLAPTDDKGNAVVPSFNVLIGDRTVGTSPDRPPWMEDPEVANAINGSLAQTQQNQGLSREAEDVSHNESRTDDASH